MKRSVGIGEADGHSPLGCGNRHPSSECRHRAHRTVAAATAVRTQRVFVPSKPSLLSSFFSTLLTATPASIGQAGSCGGTSVGQSLETWLPSWTGWVWLDRTGCTRCAPSVACSSKRQVERARLCALHRVAHGAGFRARRPRKLGFCRQAARSPGSRGQSRNSIGLEAGQRCSVRRRGRRRSTAVDIERFPAIDACKRRRRA